MKRYMRALSVLFVFALLLVPFQAYADQKMAYVDVAILFDEYEKTKENDAMLKNLGEEKEKARDALVNDIRALKDEMVLLTDEAKQEKQQALDAKIRELQAFDQEAKQELGTKRNELVREIFKDIDEVVQRYGERKGYDMILNERALLYQNEKFNVTQEVLTELNKSYKK